MAIGEITAFWSKGEHQGRCSNCSRLVEHIAVIKLNENRETIRFCPPCLGALVAITESMAEEAMEWSETQ